MMQPATELDLATKIQLLEADRRRHAEAIAAIDQVLERVGEALAASRTSAPPAKGEDDAERTPTPASGTQPKAKRHRGRFARTAEQSVLAFIGEQGRPATSEINAHWRREGRLGTSNVVLLRLLKAGQIRRIEDPAVRGSRYVLVDAGAPTPADGRRHRVV